MARDFDTAEIDALLNAAVDGIIVTDQTGTVLRMNQAIEDLFGYGPDELIGQPVEKIMPAGDARRHAGYIRNYLQTGEARIIGIGREVEARRSDGSLFPVALSIGEARVRDDLHFVGVIRDLTRQKAAEEEALRQRALMNHASRLTTMGEMAAALAHELNQPLAAISNYTGAGIRLLELGDAGARGDLHRALSQIGSQAHRAAEIIQRIRDFARSRVGELQIISLDTVIKGILPLARMDSKAHQVDFRVEIAEALPDFYADPIQVQQVLLNLIRNGIDAMQELPHAQRCLELRAWLADPGHIRIEISDCGSGVGDEAARRLFTPFFTTKATGMGMGLAISRSIVEELGGTLGFRNNPTAGATFFVSLPVKRR